MGPPPMPFYTEDFAKDTRHLTPEQVGCYMLMIMAYWDLGKPLKEAQLPGICRVSRQKWTWTQTLLAPFFYISGDNWVHKRVETELRRADIRAKRAAKAGKASVKSRRGRKKYAAKPLAASPELLKNLKRGKK